MFGVFPDLDHICVGPSDVISLTISNVRPLRKQCISLFYL